MPYPKPDNEIKRLEALKRYGLLDTPSEDSYDDFVNLASFICEAPIALISLLDEQRQWFKARVGLNVSETPREQAFCSHTIQSHHTMVVEDAMADERFSENPLVCSAPNIRFYAGVPLTDADGYALGTLCVIDRRPRHLEPQQQQALEALARQLVTLCQYRRASADLAGALEDVKTLRSLLPICSYCKDIRNDQGYWRGVEEYFSTITDARFSHSICPRCVREHYPDMGEDQAGEEQRK